MKKLLFILYVILMQIVIYGTTTAEPLRIIFVGDLMLDDGPGRVIASGRDPLAAVAPLLAQADYRIGNLETAVATTGEPIPKKRFTFRAHPRVLSVLRGRFDALAVSNNHSCDYGSAAFLETLSHLDAGGIAYFGGGRNLSAAHTPLWIERHGLRIAVLGYSEFKPRQFEAGSNWPGIAWSEDSHVVNDIHAARAAHADRIIIFMHWGWEKESNPVSRQRQLAHLMIDAGADIVIGGHPHIVQNSEYYKGHLIVYSLGNFVFDSFDKPEFRTGWILRLTFDKSGFIAWNTVAVIVDDEGVPTPQSGAKTPCGRAGDTTPNFCDFP